MTTEVRKTIRMLRGERSDSSPVQKLSSSPLTLSRNRSGRRGAISR